MNPSMRVRINPQVIVFEPGSVVIEIPESVGVELCACGAAEALTPVMAAEDRESPGPKAAERAVTRRGKRR